MSSLQIRPSILLRKKRDPSTVLSNSQHLEFEHEREEARLQAKRELRAQREHVRGQQLWGSSSDKAELAARERAEHDALLDARRRLAERERAESQKLAHEMAQREQDVRQAELAKLEQKRAYLATLRDENNRLAEMRRQIEHNKRQEEKVMAQQNAGATLLDKFGRHAY